MKNPLVQGLLLAAIVGAATFAANTLSASASGDDVEKAVAAHANHPHVDTALQLSARAAADARQDEKLAKLEDVPAEIRGIRARIDMMVLGEPRRSPRRARMRKAAAKIRSAARQRGEADPLAGLEDL